MKILRFSLIGLVVLAVLVTGFIYGGLFNVAADEPHWGVTYRLIESTRQHSVAVRARNVSAFPGLNDAKLIADGAGEYDEMCTGCHLAPGMTESELRAGLYPKPPDLTKPAARLEPTEAFWIIKHGLKMTGMPAWGVTHDDSRIWSMVAFLQKLPDLSPQAYHELTSQNGGHHHGDEADEEHEGGSSAHSHGDEDGTKPTEHQHNPGASAGEGVSDHAHSTGDSRGALSANAPLPAATAEPVATVESFFRALASGNPESATRLLDSNVVIYESGGVERSRAEYAAHHVQSDAQFLKTAKQQVLSRTGDAVGDLAWVATEARITGSSGGKSVKLVSTETMILRKNADGWRIVHIHWSSRPASAAQ